MSVSILEIGNVLSHYGEAPWRVVDRYEQAAGVVNADITTWRPSERFGLAVSISTIEHIGFDEEVQDQTGTRIVAAIENVRDNCLLDGGEFVFTVPIGYNPALDRLILDRHPAVAIGAFMRRVGTFDWRQVTLGEALGTRFGNPFPYANAIMIGRVPAMTPIT